ncbi:MAG: hypothetical protein A2Z24_02605 [Candidatus Woykebacteria bacterium RBG_16_44_10]|uniref:Uncharacterized protein n=1 Tax=Candidatus Woykebacteria bacterium RBG_16_44_10 TaxID=1802597 RepID=A0A1G1WEA3_9BACT|nr:MAG: hypothetical protein A2Z24_02605 [Candidatus Woykebacteria bacterium RBG_16_44_10]
MNSFWRDIIWRISHISPLVWAFVLLFVAFLLIKIPTDFTKKLAALPLLVAILLFYQAIFRGKMY